VVRLRDLCGVKVRLGAVFRQAAAGSWASGPPVCQRRPCRRVPSQLVRGGARFRPLTVGRRVRRG